MLRRWEQARGGQGRVVLLSGEAGIGKSRLSAALDERLLGEPHMRLRWFCAPHYQDTALHPVISNMVRHAGFERDDDAATKLAKLEALLAHTATPAEDVALIADLLSLPVGAEARLAELTPQRRKERSFAAVLRQYEGLARTQPLVGVFEDLHWADPTTLELLDQLVAAIEHLPMLLVATSRPDSRPSWAGQPHVLGGDAEPARTQPGRVDGSRRRRRAPVARGAASKSLPMPTACRCSWRNWRAP